MPRPLDLLEKLGDVVEVQAGPELPEVSCDDPERLRRARGAPGCEAGPDRLVHDGAEGPPSPVDLRLEPLGQVVVESQRRSHVLMLPAEHHDVNWWAPLRADDR